MKNYNETLARLYELDSKRPSGDFEVFTIASESGCSYRIFILPFEDKSEAIDVCHIPRDWQGEHTAHFLAAAPTMMQVIRHQREVIEGLKRALGEVCGALEGMTPSSPGQHESGQIALINAHTLLEGNI